MPMWLQIVLAASLGALLSKWLPDLRDSNRASARLEQRVITLEKDLSYEHDRNNSQDGRLTQLEVLLARIEGKLDTLIYSMETHGVK